VTGEIYIGGDGVGRGYLNRPALTADRFLDDPFGAPGDRMYRTGDLGRWLPDGTVEYLGRNDHQVKIRGFRIELGEIETRLSSLAGVKEVVVLAREDQPGDKRLVAYYTADEPLAIGVLREHLAERLPDYMVPSAYVQLAVLPVNANGKVDRKALPAPERQAHARRTYVAPEGEIEQQVAALWAEMLSVERVGRHDSFFDLGGHSLLAVRMLARLRERLGTELAVRELFARPTVAELVAGLARATADPLPANLTVFRRAGTARPIFFIHPGLGEIGYVSALLPGIDIDTPVYGLAAIGFLTGEQPLQTIEEMAAAYNAAIRRVQPRGPYRIVGWCAGGNIGFEMARQLLEAGEAIEFLGMLNSPFAAPMDTSAVSNVLSRLPDVIPDSLRARLEDLALIGDNRGMLRACQTAGMLPADLPLDLLERYMVTQHSITLAKLHYVPPRLPITVTHFMTRWHAEDWDMDGWEAKADHVVRITVGGEHMTMVEPPHAESLARQISSAIRAAATRRDPSNTTPEDRSR